MLPDIISRGSILAGGVVVAVVTLGASVSIAEDVLEILATDSSGGWANVDILSPSEPLERAKRCVAERWPALATSTDTS